MFEYVKGNDVRGRLIEIYDLFASRHNVMFSRSQKRWDDFFDVPYFNMTQIFYWKDPQGEIKALVKLKRNDKTMEIADIAWVDYEGMIGIIQFIGMYEGAADKFAFNSSPEFVPELLFGNLYEVGIEPAWIGMNRIINAKRAFELMKKPKGKGKFSVKLTDGFASWNNGTYSVEYGGGDCKVDMSNSSSADIETNERALAQLILGIYDFNTTSRRNDVVVNGNAETLSSVFVKKPLHLTDHF